MSKYNSSMHLAAANIQNRKWSESVRGQGRKKGGRGGEGESSLTLQEAASLPIAVSTTMSSLRIGNLKPQEAPSALLLAPAACTIKGFRVRLRVE